MINPVKMAGRAMLATVFIGGGLNQLKSAAQLGPVVDSAKEEYAIDVDVPGETLVKLNGAGMMAAGSAMALGILPRVSALSLVGLLVPTTIAGHPFWKETEDAAKQTQITSFASNTAVAGGLLMVAAS